ncbi:MAG: divergent polysaccharide deacetylase family protein [Sulfurovum sp.]|nr:divergent polysaccharide deacetylase family protein [Sulfurovum sp.]
MAARSKKSSDNSIRINKKASAEKTTNRRSAKAKKNKWKIHAGVIMAAGVMILLVVFGYFLGQHDKNEKHLLPLKIVKTQETKTEKVNHGTLIADDALLIKEHHMIVKRLQEKGKTLEEDIRSQKKERTAVSVEKGIRDSNLTPSSTAKLLPRKKKARLAIIIDDVSNAQQLNKIRSLPSKLTPSIFPPSEFSSASHKLVHDLKHYMVHLPMESGSVQMNKMHKTLKVNDTPQKIRERIEEIRRLFPTARYLNNHTGSVYTSNEKAMSVLYPILRENGFIFVDSRTSAKTKVRQIAHAYKDLYIYRDTFLDNIQNKGAIRKQLKQAVKIAKKNGHAIAIAHPHTLTLQALKEAQDILKEVDVVYIDELFQE